MNLQNKNRPTDIENRHMVTRGQGGEGGGQLRGWDVHVHTPTCKTDEQ